VPDRLPSLIVLAGFWIPPALAGWAAAARVAAGARRATDRERLRRPDGRAVAFLTTFVAGYAAAWFVYNVYRMPPYVPGATLDPTVATPQAVRWLTAFTTLLILPGSTLACVLAYRRRSSSAGGARP
jgi:hypothetical protein